MREAEWQNLLASFSQNPPKILVNYYSTSRIENILSENAKWGQIFSFTPTGYLGKIILVHPWNPDVYTQVFQLVGTLPVLSSVYLTMNIEHIF